MQLEVGTNGNSLSLYFDAFGCLATPWWFKSLWDRLWQYMFYIYLDYSTILFPRLNDALMVDLFVVTGDTKEISPSKESTPVG